MYNFLIFADANITQILLSTLKKETVRIDSSICFLLSLSTSLKKLNEGRRLHFQEQCFKIIEEELNSM